MTSPSTPIEGYSGHPTQNQTIAYADPLASVIKNSYSSIGLGLSSETTTIAAYAVAARIALIGDGGSNPGIGIPVLQSSVAPFLNTLVGLLRYDMLLAQAMRGPIAQLNAHIIKNIPTNWSFVTQNSTIIALDAFLTRLNGANPNAPGTPSGSTLQGTLTAQNQQLGTMPLTGAGNAPRVVHTFVGTYDYYESLPGAEAAQVALTGGQNAYQYQIGGTVPANTKKVRIYRGLFGGFSGGPYYWDQDVAVSTGAAFPAINLVNSDTFLRKDLSPPSWLQCLMVPEFAAAVALAYASLPRILGAQTAPMQFLPVGMLSPWNVWLGPSNGFCGIGNPPQGLQFGSRDLTASFVASIIQTTNNNTNNVQGYAGGFGIQARVTSNLNGTANPTITYTYYDAAHGWGNIQNQAGATPVSGFANNAPIGSIITWSIPAGRIVRSVTETGVSGTATTGTYVYEAPAARSY